MGLFYAASVQQLVEIDDDTYAMWVQIGNPKADFYQPVSPAPHPSASWDGEQWIVPPLSAFKDAKKAAIKLAARSRILARYPEWMQANLTARAVELVSLGELAGPEWGKMQAIWSWIKAVRAHSDLLEADVDACTTAEAVEAMSIEAGWPE